MSFAGNDRGGGGDLCERRIQEIRDDIFIWLQKGGAEGLKNLKVSPEEYSARMSYFLKKTPLPTGAVKPETAIECVHHPIEVQGIEKVCRFDLASYGPKITCNAEVFLDKNTMTADAQYQLVYHEYSGIAGFEVPSNSQSTYLYSNQISAFLEDQVVRKLAVKPLASDPSQLVEFPYIEFESIPAGAKMVFTKPFVVPAGRSGVLLSDEGITEGEYNPTRDCEIKIAKSSEARTLALGPEGYRAFSFQYVMTEGSLRPGSLALMENGHEAMRINCEDEARFRRYFVTYFRKAGIKLMLGPSAHF
jgi:hypothetical protein